MKKYALVVIDAKGEIEVDDGGTPKGCPVLFESSRVFFNSYEAEEQAKKLKETLKEAGFNQLVDLVKVLES